jgi:peptide/nickel transport system substrate-binding protein
VFGRSFTAAQFAWSVPGGQTPCDLFSSAAIPGPYPQSQQEWGGANLSGYANTAFDQACLAARTSLPGAEQTAAWQQVEQIFAQDLPALPLYWRPRLYVTKTQICGLFAGSEGNIPILNLESVDIGDSCLDRD